MTVKKRKFLKLHFEVSLTLRNYPNYTGLIYLGLIFESPWCRHVTASFQTSALCLDNIVRTCFSGLWWLIPASPSWLSDQHRIACRGRRHRCYWSVSVYIDNEWAISLLTSMEDEKRQSTSVAGTEVVMSSWQEHPNRLTRPGDKCLVINKTWHTVASYLCTNATNSRHTAVPLCYDMSCASM